MKLSYNWLSTYLNTDLDIHKISEILTNIGLEVEGISATGSQKSSLEGVTVGKVLTLQKHPNADKLKVATVDIGENTVLQIVCGAPNIEEAQKVAVATVGSVLTSPDGKEWKIKEAKLRGVESFGMICSEAELGISENHDGIWLLEPSIKVGTPLKELIKKQDSDYLIEIGLTPNRTDAMSHYGVARDLNAALINLNLKATFQSLTVDEFDKIELKGESPVSVEIKNSESAPRYAGLYLENIQIKESPEWLQNFLKTIGLTPINNVVDITNYILHDLGQPLHAFDAEKITNKKIIVQTSKKGDKFKTLDGVERELNGSELMISDKNGGLCMAGIYGGIDSGVNEQTQSIFLESAYFEPVSIRKSAKFHGLNTDSSFRFERGTDPNMVIPALKKAALLLIEYANAEIKGKIFDFYPIPIQDAVILLRYHKIDQLLGQRLHRETIKNILNSLDIQILSKTDDSIEVIVPPYRADVQREVDLIEEILRIYGYNKIENPEKIAFSVNLKYADKSQTIENFAAQTLISLGFFEVMNNSVGSLHYQDIFNLNKESGVQLLNPLSSDLMLMRQSLLPGLLENTEYNINRKSSAIRFFEFGKIYNQSEKSYHEQQNLALVLSGNKTIDNWNNSKEKLSFFTLKGIVFSLLNQLGINDIDEKPCTNSIFSEGLQLELSGKNLGILGEVHSKILKKMDIDQSVFYAELDWDFIVKITKEHRTKFKEISKFPSVKRDLALLIDKSVSYADLHQSVKKLNLNSLKSVQLFDVYEGDKLPQGKKSYAMSFTLQNEEKTLNDKEIDEIMQKLIRNFKENFQAELRG
ncbi:MAG: phenylalanine--tRNA ligase subunit beta [Weeksellaceae bacterium]|jgi:phenylalanyl-tRNA synthetase beta chain|nr:phenylalanine--tRNA ligase subunit beta [Weeksellaceae bacterium]MDX9704571.1 phenylalanine--tRNA ligase subunit beta [Weeksellaceae bacterium]